MANKNEVKDEFIAGLSRSSSRQNVSRPRLSDTVECYCVRLSQSMDRGGEARCDETPRTKMRIRERHPGARAG